MKKIFILILACVMLIISAPTRPKVAYAEDNQPIMAIVIDDFGGYDRGGVEEMLAIKVPLTCAVIPFVDNTKTDSEKALQLGHEVILHMPMESHVNLPSEWYGPTYIRNNDSGETACTKLDACLKEVPMAKGVNIHIGSGVCRNEQLMTSIISHLQAKDLYFCDSRTHEQTKCKEACTACNQSYLGRDVFLEPHGQSGYANACKFLMEGAHIALNKGYSVAIGHVGREGGVLTAKAIADCLAEIEKLGVKIVPLSAVYDKVKASGI